jgi:hypothetical protein
MSNLTHLKDGNTKVKFRSRILEKSHVGSETGSRSYTNRNRIRKNYSGSIKLIVRAKKSNLGCKTYVMAASSSGRYSPPATRGAVGGYGAVAGP